MEFSRQNGLLSLARLLVTGPAARSLLKPHSSHGTLRRALRIVATPPHSASRVTRALPRDESSRVLPSQGCPSHELFPHGNHSLITARVLRPRPLLMRHVTSRVVPTPPHVIHNPPHNTLILVSTPPRSLPSRACVPRILIMSPPCPHTRVHVSALRAR